MHYVLLFFSIFIISVHIHVLQISTNEDVCFCGSTSRRVLKQWPKNLTENKSSMSKGWGLGRGCAHPHMGSGGNAPEICFWNCRLKTLVLFAFGKQNGLSQRVCKVYLVKITEQHKTGYWTPGRRLSINKKQLVRWHEQLVLRPRGHKTGYFRPWLTPCVLLVRCKRWHCRRLKHRERCFVLLMSAGIRWLNSSAPSSRIMAPTPTHGEASSHRPSDCHSLTRLQLHSTSAAWNNTFNRCRNYNRSTRKLSF